MASMECTDGLAMSTDSEAVARVLRAVVCQALLRDAQTETVSFYIALSIELFSGGTPKQS